MQAKAKVKSRAAPKAYSYAMENDQFADEQSQGFSQESSLSFTPAFQYSPSGGSEEFTQPEIGGTFRSSATGPKSKATKSEMQKDPRSGLEVPPEMAVGKIATWVRCPDCQSSMVLRRNREDAGLFTGCSQFPRCRGTRKFTESIVASRPSGWSGSDAGQSGRLA